MHGLFFAPQNLANITGRGTRGQTGRVRMGDEGSPFRPKQVLPKARAAFSDHEIVELHDASHYIQEDAPEMIADAIRGRFA